MTEYFEVLQRDGPARLGELRLDSPVRTPVCIDDILVDAGSIWSSDRSIPEEAGTDRLTILPHRGFPRGTERPVAEAFAVEYPDLDVPSMAVISSEFPTEHNCDAYALSDVQALIGHAEAIVEGIISVRNAIQPDTALFVSGVATPSTVPLLSYLGVDCFDTVQVEIAGSEGTYLTTHGEYELSELAELPCSCPTCDTTDIDAFDRSDCIDHNVAVLEGTLRTVRQCIRTNRLRRYLDGVATRISWQSAAMSHLSAEGEYLETHTPVLRDGTIEATTDSALDRVEIERYANRITTRYRNRFDNPLVLLPCSARKPYSESKSYARFHDAIQWRGHVVSLTSPLGVVPQELETTFPAQHYDSAVSGHWSENELAVLSDRLRRYLDRNTYREIIAHVPDGGYREIVDRATADIDRPITFTVESHPTDEASLENLSSALSGQLKYAKRERQHHTVRAIADYFFGDGAGDDLFEDIVVTGRYPKLQVRRDDDTQLAAMVPRYGSLAFTIAGGRRWVDSDVPTRRVEIDAFVPHGSVLAPGVVAADPTIRIGDEVVIEGPSAFCVGRASMSGPEMERSSRGVACDVRHVEER